jgi:hypothetical protein
MKLLGRTVPGSVSARFAVSRKHSAQTSYHRRRKKMTSQSIIGPKAATEAPVDEKVSNLER